MGTSGRFAIVSITRDEDTAVKDRGRGLFSRFSPQSVSSFAGKLFRRLDSASGRSAESEETVSSGSEAASPSAGDSTADENAAPPPEQVISYSPRDWQFSEEPSEDSRFIGLMILAANHRAGSTLLQRICNSRKETLIWGEHNALLRHFAGIYHDAAKFSLASKPERDNYFAQDENPNLWIASMCPELEYAERAVVASARALLRAFFSQSAEGHDLIGFKEVQYGRSELELLRKCYPEAQILLLVRNPLHTWRSTPPDWYPSLDDWIEKWNGRVKCFRDYAGEPNCHLIRYEDLIRQDEKTMRIVADAARISRRQIELVLANKIGASLKTELEPAVRDEIADRCREEMAAMGYN